MKPALFAEPVPLTAGRFGAVRLGNRVSFEVARSLVAIPLGLVEITQACRDYPVVFSRQEPHTLVAITGFQGEQNLFIDARGQWEAERYIPAYLRRYPFMLVPSPQDPGIAALGIDARCKRLNRRRGDPLFDGTVYSSLSMRMLAFCQTFQREYGRAAAFSAAMASRGLLDAAAITFPLPDRDPIALHGMVSLRERVIESLSAETLREFAEEGSLEIMVALGLSKPNWLKLIERWQSQRRR